MFGFFLRSSLLFTLSFGMAAANKAITLHQLEELERVLSSTQDVNQKRLVGELKRNMLAQIRKAHLLSEEEITTVESKYSEEHLSAFKSELEKLASELAKLSQQHPSPQELNSALLSLEQRIEKMRHQGPAEQVNEIAERYSQNTILNCTELAFNRGAFYCSDGSFCRKSEGNDTLSSQYTAAAKSYLHFRFGMNEILQATGGQAITPHSTE